MAAPMPEPAYVRAADLVILFYIYDLKKAYGGRSHCTVRTRGP